MRHVYVYHVVYVLRWLSWAVSDVKDVGCKVGSHLGLGSTSVGGRGRLQGEARDDGHVLHCQVDGESITFNRGLLSGLCRLDVLVFILCDV